MGFTIDNKLISFAAKTLITTGVECGPQMKAGKTKLMRIRDDTAAWNMKDVGFARGASINQLHVLPLQGRMLECVSRDFIKALHKYTVEASPGYNGIQSAPLHEELPAHFELCADKDCTLVVLRTKDYDMYSTVKRIGDLHHGQHTLCAIESKLQPGFKGEQYYANLALKVNMKMGGDNWFPDQQALDSILGKQERQNTLILGADVTHPGAGTRLGYPSIACVVGTVDNVFMKYFGSMRLQAGGQEASRKRAILELQLTCVSGH
jgi:hypothetical protein